MPERQLSLTALTVRNLRAKKISGRLTNDRLFDWKVIALAATPGGTGVALVGSAQSSSGAAC
jgi:hypothetical protein